MLPERRDSDLLLELYALGELPGDLRPEVERRLAEDPKARAYLERRTLDHEQILRALPPGPAVAEIQRRAERQRRARRVRLGVTLAVPLAAAAALLLVLLPGTPRPGVDPGPDQVLIKGATRLQLYRNGKGLPLAPGARVAPGDVLELRYMATGQDRHGVILSADGRGQVSLHFPSTLESSTAMQQDRTVELDHAFELDDTPGFERFLFITSSLPLDAGGVLRAARALGGSPDAQLELPASAALRDDLLLKKEAEPTDQP